MEEKTNKQEGTYSVDVSAANGNGASGGSPKLNFLQKLLQKTSGQGPGAANSGAASPGTASSTDAATPKTASSSAANSDAATPKAASPGSDTGSGGAANSGTTAPSAASSVAANSSASNITPASSAGNVFTRLFGNGASGSMSGGASATPPTQPTSISLSQLLGPKPITGLPLTKDQQQRTQRTSKRILNLSIILALLAYGLFYIQLNPNFTLLSKQLGPNIASRFESGNSEIQKMQTDINFTRFRAVRLLLDEVNLNIDPFERQSAIANSEFSTDSQRRDAEVELQILGAKIKKTLSEAQIFLNQPLGVDTYSQEPVTPEDLEKMFAKLLKDKLNKQRSQLAAIAAPDRDEIRMIDNILRFLDNGRFRDMLRSQNLATISEADFGAMLAKIREDGTDELSAIDRLRKQRLDWTRTIQDIHTVTRKADLYYGQGLFKTVGGFLFDSYSFDSTANRINITGTTRTSDSKTFSFIAKLIDAIEKSPKFKDIDFRTFSKMRDESGDYSAALKLDFALQQGPDFRDDVPESEKPPTSTPSTIGPEAEPKRG